MSYQITGHTRLGGLLGSPVSHSISPMMHNEAFRLLGLDYVYLCFDTSQADFGNLIHALRDMQVFGFNLTMPDKERILEYLDSLSPAAQMIGAVNTVRQENGILTGHNTDGIGYLRSVRDTGYDITKAPMTLLGAGGAASSIAIQAALDGVPKLHIFNRRGRSWNNAIRLADTINQNTACQADVSDLSDQTTLAAHLAESGLLTNATSIGMAKQEGLSPIPDSVSLPDHLLVSDIIYNPRKTRLLAQAEAQGCQICNGMYMLLYQGAEAFRIWTGQEMPVEEIRNRFFAS